MESIPELKLSEFSKALTTGRIMSLRIISCTLLMGVTAFLGIIFFMYLSRSPARQAAEGGVNDILPLLTIVHVAIAFLTSIIALILPKILLSDKMLKKTFSTPVMQMSHRGNAALSPEEDTPEARVSLLFATIHIIRMAMFEGITLFGLIVCLLGVLEGQMQEAPVYWLNLFSYGLFILVFLLTFPGPSKWEAAFQSRFMSDDTVLRAS